MKTNELTFENWLAGKFDLDGIYSLTDHKTKDLPPKVSLQSIHSEELHKIQEEQQKIFDRLVKKLSTELIDDFNERYIKSPSPHTTLRLQANFIVATIRGKKYKINPLEYVIKHTGQIIPNIYYAQLQNYVNLRLKGNSFLPSFIPSPNSNYIDLQKVILPEVYVESLVNLYIHLSKYDKSIDPLRLFKEDYRILYHDEPYNEAPEIFTSGYALQLFYNLEEVLITQPPKPGDYKLIFNTLKHELTNGLHKHVSLAAFFEFVNEVNGFHLNPTSNRPSQIALKKSILSFFLRSYFRSITDKPLVLIEVIVDKVIEQKMV